MSARDELFQMSRPRAVIHLPHAATLVPSGVREQFVLSDEQLADEVRLMTDHLTDELFAVSEAVALTVRFPVSRLVVDPERFEVDEDELMSGRGMGAVYEQTSRQTPLRRPLIDQEREALLQRWYRPHHEALTAAVATVLQAKNSCLIIDAQSFPSVPLPYELDQNPDRPDICIGADEFHTPPALRDLAVALCLEAGWTVTVNRPFAGALVPMAYFGKDSRVRAVMIEVNRRLYLDQQTGVRGPGFDRCRATISRVINGLIEASGTTGDISPVLWSAYESTVFCATLDGTEIRIGPGEMHAPLDHALEARSVTTWAYITAWNPGSWELSIRENDARHERLKEEVLRLGFEAFEGEGQPAHAAWVPERSLLVLGVPASEAVAIGRRYGQNAIVFGEHRREARLLSCSPDTAPTTDRE
jgi:N-formylglutamate deformylase